MLARKGAGAELCCRAGAAKCIEAYMEEVIAARKLEEPLYIVDLGRVVRLFEAWRRALPRVAPFYAVKCFTDKAVIATLAALGAGFDCASEYEVWRATPHH